VTHDALTFLAEFARHPRTVGAVAPSSAVLSRRMVTSVPLTGDPVVLELGPGTGVFTTAIQQRLAGRGRHVAIEINDRFARDLAGRHRRVHVVAADAVTAADVLRGQGLPAADVVISGLPWALFGPERQIRLLDVVTSSLTANGAFTTFAYLHALWTRAARRLHSALHERFEQVVPEQAIWANLPPATIYHCHRPIATVAASPRRIADTTRARQN
jgi:phospholipid N-methyltransferase